MIPKALKCPECGSPLKGLPCTCSFCGNYIYDGSAPVVQQVGYGMYSPRTHMSTCFQGNGTMMPSNWCGATFLDLSDDS
jgi:hypothetical protein